MIICHFKQKLLKQQQIKLAQNIIFSWSAAPHKGIFRLTFWFHKDKIRSLFAPGKNLASPYLCEVLQGVSDVM